MIAYKKVNIVSMNDLRDFIIAKGYNSKLIWVLFYDGLEYNLQNLAVLCDMIAENDDKQSDKIAIYNCVIEAMHNGELPKEFLLTMY